MVPFSVVMDQPCDLGLGSTPQRGERSWLVWGAVVRAVRKAGDRLPGLPTRCKHSAGRECPAGKKRKRKEKALSMESAVKTGQKRTKAADLERKTIRQHMT